ncbi:unnamed protein product [Acanthoscelides obtectus]|uniref:Uncharacterized protein n=1 Tax=Acanthoscelides obtectus TaxID=200917 RepID=A0A9P0K1L1_ACAOB|nr:unnamed protein product [Acanthoscelides obtectus]CAK1657048.1 hypothetical protein AOBTE_LOCUS20085 [Acanthoscelides obtectus]
MCGNFRPRKIFNESKTFCHRYTIVTYFLYSMVGGSAHISALLHLDSDQKGTYFTANETCYDFMPYLFIVPFNTETTAGCKNAFIMMDVGLWILASYIASYDALFCSLLICLKTELHILCEATKNIRERVIMKLELPEDYHVFKDVLHPELETEMYDEIRRLIFHLESLLKYENKKSTVIDQIYLYSETLMCMTGFPVVSTSCCMYS